MNRLWRKACTDPFRFCVGATLLHLIFFGKQGRWFAHPDFRQTWF